MKCSRLIYLLAVLFITMTRGTKGVQSTGPRPIHKEKDLDESKASEPSITIPLHSDTRTEEKSDSQIINTLTDVETRIPTRHDDSDQTISGSSFLPTKTPLSNSASLELLEGSTLLLSDPHSKGEDNNIINQGPLKEGNRLRIPENKLGLLINPVQNLNRTSLPNAISSIPPTQSNFSHDKTATYGSPPQNDTLNSQATMEPNSFSSRHPPSGSIYVETVHKSVYPERSLRVGSSTPCPTADFEDTDFHQQSHSQFGYPKSIVSKALGESYFSAMLKILEDQIYLLNHQNINNTDANDLVLSDDTEAPTDYTNWGRKGFPVNKGPAVQFKDTFGASLSNNDFQFEKNTELPNMADSTPTEDGTESKLNPRLTGGPGGGLKFPFNLQNGLRDTSPHLLEGSAFESQLALSPLSQSFSDESSSHSFEPFTQNDRSPVRQSILPARINEKQFLRETQTKESESNRFSKNLPDVSGGEGTWFTSNIYPRSMTSFDEQRRTSYDSGVDGLFPPKSSDNFLDISSSDDFAPKREDSFLKYSPDRSSVVSSPFQLDTKSLFSSLSGVSVSEESPKQSSGVSLSEFQPQTSAFPHAKFTSLQSDSSKKLTERFQSTRFGLPRGIRRKRRASIEGTSKSQPKIEDSCASSPKLLRQYKNYGGSCFVVQPEIQGINFVTCANRRCRGCHVDGGDSRCQAVHVPMWVWSYCEEGPNAGQVMADRVQVSVACTCKVSICTLSGE